MSFDIESTNLTCPPAYPTAGSASRRPSSLASLLLILNVASTDTIINQACKSKQMAKLGEKYWRDLKYKPLPKPGVYLDKSYT